MKHKRIALVLLLSSLLVTTVAAYSFIISKTITETVTVTRPDLILITVTDFPSAIEFGKNYAFKVVTESLADEELTGLVSWITIQYIDTENNVVSLDPSWFYIYYNDITTPWEGEIQDTFTWSGTYQYLYSTAMGGGSWTAEVGYETTAWVTFRILALAPLPDGTVTWEAWVEASTL